MTCRPYAYREPQWQLPEFESHTLAPFDDAQIERFIEQWYETVGPLEGVKKTEWQAKSAELVNATKMPHLHQLAERPLLLTLMATLHTSRGKLPDDRADLYGDCVTLLLDYWQRGKTPLDEYGITRSQLENALSRVAFEAHRQQGGTATTRKQDTADITGEQLRQVLAPALGNSLDKANVVIRYIQERAGLLSERAPELYAFPHRTFQEFLAASYILNSQYFPYELAKWVREDYDWWREVCLLTAGRVRATMFGQTVTLMNALCPNNFEQGVRVSDAEANAIVLAAQAALDVRLRDHIQDSDFFHVMLLRLQGWLAGIIAQEILPLQERTHIDIMLVAMGDPRPDIACEIPALVDVPASEFMMGSEAYDDEKPIHRVLLDAYRIGKYPVTNAQYRRFVDDGGYTEKWRVCWTDDGWKWRAQESIEQPRFWNDLDQNIANHPVNGVSWYEAVAYCNWLTKTDLQGRVFRLPTEAEWEKSARGTVARRFPWGSEFDSTKANTSESNESKVGRTSAVGLFPRGASPYSALDMSGNVREWCLSEYRAYPYKANDGRESLEGTKWRVLRGGSFVDVSGDARCAVRGVDLPDYRGNSIGFRVAQSVASGDTQRKSGS